MSNSIKETLQAILDEASEKIEQSDALDKLNDVRVNFLGKKGQLTSVLKGMKDVAPEDRPKVGQMVNEARAKIETMMEETKTRLEKELREAKMAAEVIDVTLPAKKANVGHRHPNTIAPVSYTHLAPATGALLAGKLTGGIAGVWMAWQIMKKTESSRDR